MAVLCMKNEWIPILPEHNATHTQNGHIILSRTTSQSLQDRKPSIEDPITDSEAYIPDRFGTPEDSYDDQTGSSKDDAASNPRNSDSDIAGDFDFDDLPSTLSLADLAKLTSRLQARHAQVQCALRDANAATREAAVKVLEMMARLENETARMKNIMGTISEITGEYDPENELDEGCDGQVAEDEVTSYIESKKRKWNERTEPMRSSPDSSLRPEGFRSSPPICPSCRIAGDLTVSQRHSVYLCAEHMPNPYQDKESATDGSRMPTSVRLSSGSARDENDTRSHGRPLPSSSRDSTIIFGLTTKSTSNLPSKSKKRSLEESGLISGNRRPKRARREEWHDDVEIQDLDSLNSSTSPPKKNASFRRKVVSINDLHDPAEVMNEREEMAIWRGTPLRRTLSIHDLNDLANVESEETAIPRSLPLRRTIRNNQEEVAITNTKEMVPQRPTPLRRRLTINDFDDPEDVANVERMEALSFPL